MALPITELVEKAIKEETIRLEKDPQVTSFVEAAKQFDELVEQGVVKRRGYNLLSVDDAHKFRLVYTITDINLDGR